MSFFRRLINRLRPAHPTPEPEPQQLGVTQPTPTEGLDPNISRLNEADSQAEQNAFDKGQYHINTTGYQNVDRYDLYMGTDPEGIEVSEGMFLYGEIVLIGPDDVEYTIHVAFPTGQEFDYDWYKRQLAAWVKEENPGIQYPSTYVEASATSANWYLSQFVPKG